MPPQQQHISTEEERHRRAYREAHEKAWTKITKSKNTAASLSPEELKVYYAHQRNPYRSPEQNRLHGLAAAEVVRDPRAYLPPLLSLKDTKPSYVSDLALRELNAFIHACDLEVAITYEEGQKAARKRPAPALSLTERLNQVSEIPEGEHYRWREDIDSDGRYVSVSHLDDAAYRRTKEALDKMHVHFKAEARHGLLVTDIGADFMRKLLPRFDWKESPLRRCAYVSNLDDAAYHEIARLVEMQNFNPTKLSNYTITIHETEAGGGNKNHFQRIEQATENHPCAARALEKLTGERWDCYRTRSYTTQNGGTLTYTEPGFMTTVEPEHLQQVLNLLTHYRIPIERNPAVPNQLCVPADARSHITLTFAFNHGALGLPATVMRGMSHLRLENNQKELTDYKREHNIPPQQSVRGAEGHTR